MGSLMAILEAVGTLCSRNLCTRLASKPKHTAACYSISVRRHPLLMARITATTEPSSTMCSINKFRVLALTKTSVLRTMVNLEAISILRSNSLLQLSAP